MCNSRHSLRPPIIGLDITTESVVLVELQWSNTAQEFICHAAASHALACDKTDNSNTHEQYIAAIRLAYSQANFSTKITAFALNDHEVIKKELPMPTSLNTDVLEEYVSQQVLASIAPTTDPVYFDYHLQSSCMEVCIARQSHINNRAQLIQAAGLIPQYADVESCALARALHYHLPLIASKSPVQLIALLHCTNISLSLYIFEQLRPIYSICEPRAAEIAQQIIRHFNRLLSKHSSHHIEHIILMHTQQEQAVLISTLQNILQIPISTNDLILPTLLVNQTYSPFMAYALALRNKG